VEFQECFNSTVRGYTVPAFTFEKISPPIPPGPVSPIEKNPPPIEKEQRSVIVQFMGRFVEKRVQRVEQSITASRQQREGE
jgi:hypothetical protein